jgi:acetate kinase
MGGLDALVFSGGIGESSGEIRNRICIGLEFLGIALEPAANAANHELISAGSAAVSVFAIPADEEVVIAEGCLERLN